MNIASLKIESFEDFNIILLLFNTMSIIMESFERLNITLIFYFKEFLTLFKI